MAAFFDIDLKNVAEIVERRRGVTQETLLLDARRLGVALRNDQASQRGAMLAGNLLPHGLPKIIAEADAAIRLGLGEKNSPAIFRHAHEAVGGPAFGVNAGGGAQINIGGVEIAGP